MIYEEARLVTASGEPYAPDLGLEPGRPYLHVLPQLYFPYGGDLREMTSPDDVRLAVLLDGADVTPRSDGWRWGRPYPNGNHIVFGAGGRKMGFFHPLADGACGAELTLRWEIPRVGLTVEHTVSMRLALTEHGLVYSTDVPLFARGFGREDAEYRVARLHTVCDEAHVDEKRRGINRLEFGRRAAGGGELITVRESITLPSAAAKHFTFPSFEGVALLRDQEHQSGFGTRRAEHEANAAVHAADYSALVDAINLAREVPYARGPYADDPESHPAVRRLCEWWDGQAAPGRAGAGTFWLWVRVNDDGEYWNAYRETPNEPIAEFSDRESSARFGDAVLVVFCRGRAGCWADGERWVNLPTVAGEVYERVGMDMDEYHPAWYALEASSK